MAKECSRTEANAVAIESQVQTEAMASYESFCMILPRDFWEHLEEGLIPQMVSDLNVVDKWIDTHIKENCKQWWAHISIGDLTHVLNRMPLSKVAIAEITAMTDALQTNHERVLGPPACARCSSGM